MPRYEFRCEACMTAVEIRCSAADNPGGSVPCPQCSWPARRVFHPTVAIFRGSGFHSTDYRRPPAIT